MEAGRAGGAIVADEGLPICYGDIIHDVNVGADDAKDYTVLL